MEAPAGGVPYTCAQRQRCYATQYPAGARTVLPRRYKGSRSARLGICQPDGCELFVLLQLQRQVPCAL
jgi:hypothetical protein